MSSGGVLRPRLRSAAWTYLSGAVDHLLAHEAVTATGVGAVGFCMGGGFVLSLAAQAGEKVSAAVPFYGLPGDETDFSGLTAHVQGHYGRQDRSIPEEAVRSAFARIEEASDQAPEVHLYDAGHAFLNDEDLIGTYDPENAAVAWGRAVDFLREHVG